MNTKVLEPIKRGAIIRKYSWISFGGTIYSLIHKGVAMYTAKNKNAVVDYAKRHNYYISREDERIFTA